MWKQYLSEWQPVAEKYVSPWGNDDSGRRMVEPKRAYPISERRNFELVLNDQRPVYMPFITDMLAFSPRIIPDNFVRAWVLEIDPLLPGTPCAGGPDMFGVEWQYVQVTGGSMVKPGQPKIEDITRWEEFITFPELDTFDWEGSAHANAPLFHPDRMTRVWLMNGLNERLISFMDFANAMVAYVDEEQKQGIHRLFSRLCEFYDDLIERFHRYYQADVLMFNDDWGTQLGPQFSLATAREMLVPYMQRIADSCHRRGMYFELHCCGKNDQLVPAIVESNVDIWLPQENINDFELLYQLCGDKLLLGIPTDSTPAMTDEEALQSARRFMEKYGHEGHVVVNGTFPVQHPKVAEYLYCLSRETYKG